MSEEGGRKCARETIVDERWWRKGWKWSTTMKQMVPTADGLVVTVPLPFPEDAVDDDDCDDGFLRLLLPL